MKLCGKTYFLSEEVPLLRIQQRAASSGGGPPRSARISQEMRRNGGIKTDFSYFQIGWVKVS